MRNLVGAPLPPEMAEEALRIVKQIRAGQLGPRDSQRVVDTVGQITDVVMRHFFIDSTRSFGLGPTLHRVVELGVGGVIKTIRLGLKRIVPKLSQTQLRQLADFLDQSLYDTAARK